ncbi:MAG: leucine-rich repeat domain-containing protein [Pseudomonadota bacterium]
MKHHFSFHAILLVLVLMSPLAQAVTDCAAVTQIPSTECEALVTFYNSTGGANWTNKTGWNVTNTPCSWYGVSCSMGHVSRLELSDYWHNNKLTGSIPSELGNLSKLAVINLGLNKLTGSIPSELGNLSKLESLYLFDNQLTGSIPTELGNLSKLEVLDLSFNSITGSIPAKLGNFSDLESLRLNNNRLTGSIPSELGNLINLRYLQLNNNRLTGSIPSELGNLSDLESLFLSDNKFCGEIPVELKNMSNISLGNNHLTASDSELIAWLDSYNPGWETTQTSLLRLTQCH